MYDKDPLNAMEAVTAAQWLAFAPLAFQATAVMRDRGVLAALSETGKPVGRTIEEVAQATSLSVYAARVLLEAGLGLHIVWRQEGRYFLGRLGRFLLDDEMTRVNFDFTRDVCYQAAAHLDESLMQGRPAGLKELGPWPTLYEGLSVMPEPALSSWHAFDHFYSDGAFPVMCERLAAAPPRKLLDIGCNTGKWAQMCLQRLPQLEVGLVDLQPQLHRARARLEAAGVAQRAHPHPMDLLDPLLALPRGYDLVWMSQFLDCFSEDQVVHILRKAGECLEPGGRLWVLELFWDRQRFEAAAFSLQQTSLYFSCVANGNSQMYDSSVFLGLVQRAGLEISSLTDGVGGYHTLLECRVAS
ncbi:class I SAM-dependent methyltransferase [Caenimonas aquaedulcis]|uniref:Class I SAM-dependent methyltransferase n=1 Tax=Caenimonas aquaedulcis TaxID=2793270 RepID=A0A931H4R0_9BURK|nr:class I SAM-dependent methyltransferase [Caenimonas aquaedulcis]MBG9388462.1 class I SAM-dependent methyltransferase [Caenimonas aquaedulcis]